MFFFFYKKYCTKKKLLSLNEIKESKKKNQILENQN